jgi:hypothetical protein
MVQRARARHLFRLGLTALLWLRAAAPLPAQGGTVQALQDAMQSYRRLLVELQREGYRGPSPAAARQFGTRVHQLRVAVFESMRERGHLVPRPTTFLGTTGPHVYGIPGSNRYEIWVEQAIPAPRDGAGFRADFVLIDHGDPARGIPPRVTVSDITARAINDPAVLRMRISEQAYEGTVDHWIHNQERARALQAQIDAHPDYRGRGYEVVGHTPDGGHYRTAAVQRIRAEEAERRRSARSGIPRGSGPSRIGGLIGSIVIAHIIGSTLGAEAALAADGNRPEQTLSTMIRHYVDGDVTSGDFIRRNHWDRGDAELFSEPLGMGNEGLRDYLLGLLNERIDELRQAALVRVPRLVPPAITRRPAVTHVTWRSTPSLGAVTVTLIAGAPGGTLVGGEFVAEARVTVARDNDHLPVSGAPLEISAGTSGAVAVRTDTAGVARARFACPAAPWSGEVTANVSQGSPVSRSVECYDYVIRSAGPQALEAQAASKDTLELPLRLLRRSSRQDGGFRFEPPDRFREDYDHLSLRARRATLHAAAGSPARWLRLRPPRDGMLRIRAWSETTGGDSLEAWFDGTRATSPTHVLAMTFTSHPVGFELRWGSRMRPYASGTIAEFPDRPAGTVDTFPLHIIALRPDGRRVSGVRPRFTLDPPEGMQMLRSDVETDERGVALRGGLLPMVWSPQPGDNRVTISAPGATNRLMAHWTGLGVSPARIALRVTPEADTADFDGGDMVALSGGIDPSMVSAIGRRYALVLQVDLAGRIQIPPEHLAQAPRWGANESRVADLRPGSDGSFRAMVAPGRETVRSVRGAVFLFDNQTASIVARAPFEVIRRLRPSAGPIVGRQPYSVVRRGPAVPELQGKGRLRLVALNALGDSLSTRFDVYPPGGQAIVTYGYGKGTLDLVPGRYDVVAHHDVPIRHAGLVIQGGVETVLETGGYGRLAPGALDGVNAPVTHRVDIRRAGQQEVLTYTYAGNVIDVPPGTYDLTFHYAVSMIRNGVLVAAGRVTSLTASGYGRLAPEALDGVNGATTHRVDIYRTGEDQPLTYTYAKSPADLPPGSYDLVFHYQVPMSRKGIVVTPGRVTPISVGGYGRLAPTAADGIGSPATHRVDIHRAGEPQALTYTYAGQQADLPPGRYDLVYHYQIPMTRRGIPVVAGQVRAAVAGGYGRATVLALGGAQTRVDVYVSGSDQALTYVYTGGSVDLPPNRYDFEFKIGNGVWRRGVAITPGRAVVIR